MILMFSGPGSPVTVVIAASMTQPFQDNNPNASGIIAGLFSKDIVKGILEQSGCTGLRYYFAVNPANNAAGGPPDVCNTVVLVGVDVNGNDMTSGFVMEMSSPCPPTCDTGNPLNTPSS
jgi:hypothetical protein